LAGASGGVVDGKETSGERFADAGDELDDFHGTEASGGACNGAEDRELASPRGWHLWDVTAQATAPTRNESGHTGLQREHGTLDHGFAVPHRSVVESQALLKERGGIDDDVGARDEVFTEVGGDVCVVAFEFDGWVQLTEMTENGIDARFAEVIGGLQELAIEV